MLRYLLVTLLLSYQMQPTQVSPVPSAEVKAVFLYNFTGFVDWPARVLPDDNSEMVIGVLGDNPFGPFLEDAVANEKRNNHPLTVKYFKNVEDVRNCQILFINGPEGEQLAQTLAALKGRSILTVGDAPDFLLQGGMIRFYVANNKVKLQINTNAVRNAGLSISSKLLRVAEIVNAQR